jgi:maleylpyruvate isomerase
MNNWMPADQALGELRSATDRLLENIAGLTDKAAAAPSLLPDWTRGHVLTHLARNAEGGTRLLGWARTGVPSYEYVSLDARAAAIDAGAGRPAAVVIEDVRRTAAAFAAAAADMPAEAWQRLVRYTAGQEPRAEVIVPSRLAEVLIHHVDLDLGFEPADWPLAFVQDSLSRMVAGLSARDDVVAMHLAGLDTGRTFAVGAADAASVSVRGPEHALLAWLLGRSQGASLHPEPDATLPAIPGIY